MKKNLSFKQVLLLVAVLVAAVLLLGINLLRQDSFSAPPGAEGSLTAQASAAPDQSAQTDASAPARAQTEEQSEAQSAPAGEQTEEGSAESPEPVSGSLSASPLAPEGDPYPALWVEPAEKTDDNTQKIIYLTFDDGPSENTDKILDILKQNDVKASFFVTAQYGTAEERARRLKRMQEEGHTIGLHTYSHNYERIYESVDSYLTDLSRINEEVWSATGVRAELIRFPGGSSNQYNQHVCRELIAEVERRGYTYHDWAVSCGDAEGKNLSADQEIRITADECEKRSKSVVLFHDTPAQDSTVEALDGLIRELREKGYEFRALDKTIRPFKFVID